MEYTGRNLEQVVVHSLGELENIRDTLLTVVRITPIEMRWMNTTLETVKTFLSLFTNIEDFSGDVHGSFSRLKEEIVCSEQDSEKIVELTEKYWEILELQQEATD